MPAYTPRPYQREAVDAMRRGLLAGGRGQLHAACGAGKTFMGQQDPDLREELEKRGLDLAPRRNRDLSEASKSALIEKLTTGTRLKHACDALGIARYPLDKARSKDPDFDAAVRKALRGEAPIQSNVRVDATSPHRER